ncbi:carboxylating nicotinate-nucleotide diphosphorylase [Brevibacterium sp. HMSC24B04]|uniref:carboxylating nicotinate-nucleotide diphosphorylase n=1 Tax=Brevibacterium sp. HMSC24B04 TaxID=1581060 RepID=UPI0008A3765F|nr:carboxylating nicotinate-nucleotide diphosphorylase [Brevibacterium sp. HMSC24B04]OFT92697.1 nicotinate-nucleotide diphosphorylase (carboxylating) [Brevibacterium sp. HMSC24B04]
MTSTPAISRLELRNLIVRSFAEDAPAGDITAQTFIPESARFTGVVSAREPGVMADGGVFAEVMAAAAEESRTAEVEVGVLVADGQEFTAGDHLIRMSGPARAVLLGERLGLNLLQRMCAIAAVTKKFTDEAQRGFARSSSKQGSVRVADTRKTTPGLRFLERYAVRCGGGHNHRRGLSDAVMLKDNHLSLLGEGDALTEALRAGIAELGHTVHVEVEVDRYEQIEPVVAAGIGTIMLDNFTPDQLRKGVEQVAGRAVVEASGGVNLNTIADIAATGVDVISVGALTHSVVNLDLGLDALD